MAENSYEFIKMKILLLCEYEMDFSALDDRFPYRVCFQVPNLFKDEPGVYDRHTTM